MLRTTSCHHARRLEALGLTVALCLAAPQPLAAAASPFERFVGAWSGAGQVVDSKGHRERIRCKAQYSVEKGGAALDQSIVCASESYKVDIKSYVEASGEAVQGYWREATRDVSGHLTGRIAEGRFEGDVKGPNFTARISLTSNGRTQMVSIQPGSGDVADVQIELTRAG